VWVERTDNRFYIKINNKNNICNPYESMIDCLTMENSYETLQAELLQKAAKDNNVEVTISLGWLREIYTEWTQDKQDADKYGELLDSGRIQ
jgi:hypothetical protein